MTTEVIKEIAENVYMELGSGHSESVYARALCIGLQKQAISLEAEKVFPLTYLNEYIGFCRPDIIVEKTIVIEVKCLSQIGLTQRHQLLRYLRLPILRKGILINFGPHQVDFFYSHEEIF